MEDRRGTKNRGSIGKVESPKRACAFHRLHGYSECVDGPSDEEARKICCSTAANHSLAKGRAQAILWLAEQLRDSLIAGEDQVRNSWDTGVETEVPLSAIVDLIRGAACGLLDENTPRSEEDLFPSTAGDDEAPRPKAVPR